MNTTNNFDQEINDIVSKVYIETKVPINGGITRKDFIILMTRAVESYKNGPHSRIMKEKDERIESLLTCLRTLTGKPQMILMSGDDIIEELQSEVKKLRELAKKVCMEYGKDLNASSDELYDAVEDLERAVSSSRGLKDDIKIDEK